MNTRRDFLGCTAGAVAAATVFSAAADAAPPPVGVPASHPDAALLTACTEFLRIQRAHEAYCATLPDDLEDDEEGARQEAALLTPLPALVEQIVAFRATTAEGHLARARCTPFHWLPQAKVCQDDPADAPDDRFRAAELRDLVAMERGAVASGPVAARAPSPHPDAELLESCAAFDALERTYLATNFGHPPGTPEESAAHIERDRFCNAQGPLISRICALRAVTREGQAARARSYALWDAEMMRPQDDIEGLFTQAIVRDLLA